MKRHLLFFLSVLMLSGCGAIQMEKPTVKNYNKVMAMSELTPITVEQLRQMIATDTTHYKVVVITSATCGPCLSNGSQPNTPTLKAARPNRWTVTR